MSALVQVVSPGVLKSEQTPLSVGNGHEHESLSEAGKKLGSQVMH